MSSKQTRAQIERRLNDPGGPKRVGRLIETLRESGESTAEYQPRRSTEDLAAGIRWHSYHGLSAPEESQELDRRR